MKGIVDKEGVKSLHRDALKCVSSPDMAEMIVGWTTQVEIALERMEAEDIVLAMTSECETISRVSLAALLEDEIEMCGIAGDDGDIDLPATRKAMATALRSIASRIEAAA